MLLHFLQNSDKSKFEYKVFSLLGSGILTEECRKIGIEAKTFGVRNLLKFSNLISLIKAINRGKFHLIHSYGLRADLVARIFTKKRKTGYPILVSGIRSIDPQRKKIHIFLDRLTSRRVSLFISNSEAGRQVRIRREKFPAEKIVTIHNGIPISLKHPIERRSEIRKKFNFSEEEILIGHISNIREAKGHADILQAIKSLVREFPNLRFIFAGRDDSKGKIPNLVKELNISEFVRLLGFVSDPEEILCAIDIFILPSHWEGFPASILEAMLYSLPIVASNIGGIPEMIKDRFNGILIPPKSPYHLAEAIKKILLDKDLALKIKQNARKTVEEKFNVAGMTNLIEKYYLELLSKFDGD